MITYRERLGLLRRRKSRIKFFFSFLTQPPGISGSQSNQTPQKERQPCANTKWNIPVYCRFTVGIAQLTAQPTDKRNRSSLAEVKRHWFVLWIRCFFLPDLSYNFNQDQAIFSLFNHLSEHLCRNDQSRLNLSALFLI